MRPGTPVRLATPVHAELQRVTLTLAAEVGRRLSMSEIVAAALNLASQHRPEMIRLLTTPDTPGDPS